MNTPVLRCKMRVSDVIRRIAADGSVESEQVKLQAVYGDKDTANGEWSKWTPQANFEIWINNPSAIGALTREHEFYIDFVPVKTSV